MSDSEICFMTAKEMTDRIKRRELSCVEVMQAHLAQIDRINPKVNAIVTRVPEENLMVQAKAADEVLRTKKETGPLHGLPVVHKDLVPTKGMRTTFGSLVFKDHVPDHNGLIVERLQSAGAITLGKTNTPEFGAGAQTYNEVFGKTRNPYDTSKTCGGSSGGAAVSLACGMVPIADGSDMGGSLRIPANFCNVVGFRTSPGRVPMWPELAAWSPIWVQGPMARTVEDAALMLSAIAGPDDRSPISLSEPGSSFAGPLERDFKNVRIAWSRDLGELTVDSRVTKALESRRHIFEDLGCIVEEGQPDFSDAHDVFMVIRAWHFELAFGRLIETQRDLIKEAVVWNTEEGRNLTGPQIGEAEKKKTRLYHRVRKFMQTHEFLVCPVNQVVPFDVDQPYVDEINGIKMNSYIDWLKSCYYITVTGLPAISVPCGFTPEGLPVGIQIIGRRNDDFGVLQLAYAFEQATLTGRKRPALVM